MTEKLPDPKTKWPAFGAVSTKDERGDGDGKRGGTLWTYLPLPLSLQTLHRINLGCKK